MKRLSYIILPLLGVWAALLATHIVLVAVVVPNKWFAQYSELFPLFSWFVALSTMLFWSVRTMRLYDWQTPGRRFSLYRILLLVLIPLLLVVMPFVVVESRVEIAESSLHELQTVGELAAYTDRYERYFALRNYHADIASAGSSTEYYDGRGSSNAPEIDVYITCPIMGSATDTSALRSWLCIAYNKKIPLRERYKPVEQLVEEFHRECLVEFQTSDVGGFVYVERVRHERDIHSFQQAVEKSRAAKRAGYPVLFLEPAYKSFELRNEGAVTTILGICAFGVGFVCFMLFRLPLHQENFQLHRAKVYAARQRWRRYFSSSR